MFRMYELITCDWQEVATLFDEGFSFANFLVDVLAVCVFVAWSG